MTAREVAEAPTPEQALYRRNEYGFTEPIPSVSVISGAQGIDVRIGGGGPLPQFPPRDEPLTEAERLAFTTGRTAGLTEEQLAERRLYEISAQSIGIPKSDARRVAAEVQRIGETFPEIRDLMIAEPLQATQLTDAERLIHTFNSINPFGDFTPTEQTYRTIADAIQDYEYKVASSRFLTQSLDVTRSGSYQVRDLSDQRIAALGGDRSAAVDFVEVESLLDRLTGRDRTLETFYRADANRLVGKISYGSGEVGEIDINLEPGTVIESNDDMLWHLLLAEAGVKHEVRSSDGIKGRQTLIGKGFQGLGVIGEYVDRLPGTSIIPVALDYMTGAAVYGTDQEISVFDLRHSANHMLRNQNEAFIERAFDGAANAIDLDFALASVLQVAETKDDRITAAEEFVTPVLAMPEDAQLAIRDSLAEELEPDIRKAIEGLTDDRTAVKQVLDQSIESGAEVAMLYDSFVQTFATSLLATGSGALNLVQDPAGGLDHFTRAFDQAKETPRVADWFGLEGSWRTWVDVTSSLIADPLVWFTPGGKGLAQAAYRRFSTRQGVEEVMRTPAMQRLVHGITDAIDADDPLQFIANAGMVDDRFWTELLEAPADPAIISEIVKKSMPAHNGITMADLTGHVGMRNSMERLAGMARSLGDGDAANFVRVAVGNYEAGRSLSVSPMFFKDDALQSIVTGSVVVQERLGAEAAQAWTRDWLRRFMRVSDDFRNGGVALKTRAAERAKEFQKQVAQINRDTPHDVRVFGGTRRSIQRGEQRLGEINNELLQRNITDPAALTDDMLEAADQELLGLLGERDTILNGAATLRRLRIDKANLLRQPVAQRPVGWEDIVNNLDSQIDELGRVDMVPFGSDSDEFVELSRQYDEWVARKAPLLQNRQEQLDLARAAGRPGDRFPLQRFYAELYDDLGDKIGLPRTDKTNKFLRGRKVHAWDQVTGTERFGDVFGVQSATGAELMGNVIDDPDLLARLDPFPVGETPGHFALPASPAELVAFAATNDQALWRKAIIQNPAARAGRFHRSIAFLNSIWASDLLLNTRTLFRSNTDELPWRSGITRGVEGTRRNAIVGVSGDDLIRQDIPGTVGAAIDQFRGIGGRGKPLANELSASFQREMMTPYDAGAVRGYEMVEPGKTGFVPAARFTVNGLVLNDPMTRAVWSRLGNKKQFLEWWEREGFLLQKKPMWRTADGVAVDATAEAAWQSRQQLLKFVSTWVDEPFREQFRDLLTSAAGREGGLVPNSMLRRINRPMSGRVQKAGGRRFQNWLFEQTYGAIGGRRGGLVHQMFFDDAMRILWDSKTANGQLLTAEKVAEWTGKSLGTAEQLLRDAGPLLDDMVRDTNLFLPRHLTEQANRYAARQADAMMYQTGAVSLFGQRVQQVAPFLRAQYDFLTWYSREFRNAAEIGLNPNLQRALRGIGASRLVDDSVPFLGHPVQLGFGQHRVPLNIRLAARMGEIFGSAARQQQDAIGGEGRFDFDPNTPLRFLDDFTFFPVQFNDQMIMDLGPSGGPMATYLLHLLPTEPREDDSDWNFFYDMGVKVRDIAESIDPGLTFNPTSGMDALTSPLEFVLPDSRTSVVGQVKTVARTALGQLAGRLGWDLSQVPGAGLAGRPSGYATRYKHHLGLAIAEDPFLSVGSDLLRQTVADTVATTYTEVSTDDFLRTGQKLLPFLPEIADYDDSQAELFSGLVADVSALQQAGFIGDASADRLRDLWARLQQPDVTRDLVEGFTDAASFVLFELPAETQANLLLAHPEMALNMISSFRCRTNAQGQVTGPAEHCGSDGSLSLPPGEAGRDIRRQGKDNGWIVRKSELQIAEDAAVRLADARRTVQNFWWSAITGEERWSGARTTEGESAVPRRALVDDDGNPIIHAAPAQMRTAFDQMQIALPDTFTAQELADAIDLARDRDKGNIKTFDPQFDRGITTMMNRAAADAGRSGREQVQQFANGLDLFRKAMTDVGITRFVDFPEGMQTQVRREFRQQINRGFLTSDDYGQFFESFYGPLDWEPPTPPPVEQLAFARTVTPDDIVVIDGDTVDVYEETGSYRVRLIGVNAADFNSLNTNQDDLAREHQDALKRVLRSGSEITFGIFEPELYGSVLDRDPETDSARYLMWLYVDGRPVYDPSAFTFRRPTGVASQGSGVPEREAT